MVLPHCTYGVLHTEYSVLLHHRMEGGEGLSVDGGGCWGNEQPLRREAFLDGVVGVVSPRVHWSGY